MTDLTPERLDELEGGYTRQSELTLRNAGWAYVMCNAEDVLALIAMAKRTEAAERRATDMERLSRYETNFRETAERERDALRETVESIWRSYDESRAEPEYERAQTMAEIASAALAQPTTDAGGA